MSFSQPTLRLLAILSRLTDRNDRFPSPFVYHLEPEKGTPFGRSVPILWAIIGSSLRRETKLRKTFMPFYLRKKITLYSESQLTLFLTLNAFCLCGSIIVSTSIIVTCCFPFCSREKSSDLLYHGQVLIKMLDSMTVINPYLRGKTRTGTLPLTAEVHCFVPVNIES